MLGRKRLALLAGSALAVSLIGASLGTTVANAAGRPTHAMSTAGRTVHISAAAVHGTRALPGLKPAHLSPATRAFMEVAQKRVRALRRRLDAEREAA